MVDFAAMGEKRRRGRKGRTELVDAGPEIPPHAPVEVSGNELLQALVVEGEQLDQGPDRQLASQQTHLALVHTEAPMVRLSMYQAGAELIQLQGLLDEVESRIADARTLIFNKEILETLEAEQKSIEAQMEQYCLGLEQTGRVDAAVAFMRHLEMHLNAAQREADRNKSIVTRCENTIDRIKGYCMTVLKSANRTVLEGSLHKIRRQVNSSTAVDILDASQVPEKYIYVRVKMSLADWKIMQLMEPELTEGMRATDNEFDRQKIGEDMKSIRQARAKAVDEYIKAHPECGEALADELIVEIEKPFPSIPGVRLIRGEHVRIS